MGERKRNSLYIIIGLMAAIILLLIYGAVRNQNSKAPSGNPVPDQPAERVDTGFVLTGPDSYDSADTAILVAKNKDDGSVTLYNLEKSRRYTLSLDGTSRLSDKYGESVSLSQIQIGDIVDVTFLKDKKHLTSMNLSTQAWKNESVVRYEINPVRSEVTIGEDVYKLTQDTQYFSAGHAIEQMDLNAADMLNFQGIGNQVLSVRVEKGHGYLRLANGENFVGGWIEVGQTLIQKITEDMLLVVPEGSYQVNISHRGGGGTKSAVINRNEETTLDIGDLEIPEPQQGKVIFSITPSTAEFYVDGTETDASRPVDLEYGLHQLIVKAEGYKSVTQYIRVGQASAGVNIELEKINSDQDGSDDKNSTDNTGNTGSENVTNISGTYKVTIEAPEGVEAYLDGNYIGITPCSFTKVSGAHALTLRKSGYRTRSYTIQVDSEEKDISFSFVSLEEDEDYDDEEDDDEEDSSPGGAVDVNGLVSEIISSTLGRY